MAKSMKKSKQKEVEPREEKEVEPREEKEEPEQKKVEAKEEEVEQNFGELGLDPRLVRALSKKGIEKPTPIQRVAIPLIIEGKDVVARAKTGSGKTFAYLLPMLQKLFNDSSSSTKAAPKAFILVPTRELSQQVFTEALSLIELCRVQLKVVQLTSSMTVSQLKTALSGLPDIVVSTPGCISKCLSAAVLQPSLINESLDILILDEADLLLSYGYGDDLRALTSHIPRRCQRLLMSATSSTDVDNLKKLILHNPYILTLPEVDNVKDDIIPKNVEQFWISCPVRDKLLYIFALLKLDLVQKKVLVFTNTIDIAFRLKLFLEKFGIRSAVLNAELPQNSRLHMLEEFNAGLFDYLIATDQSEVKERDQPSKEKNSEKTKSRKHLKRKLDSEFGVVRGIDFKNVNTVINYDMPLTVAGYIHRIGRTGRAYRSGAAISLVSSDEIELLEETKAFLGEEENSDSKIMPFPLLTENAVESLRYRAEDVGKSVTKKAVIDSRAEDLRNEILNSEKLKAHFEANPRDMDLLKHDKILSKKPPASYLRNVPEYLVDPKTQEASKMIKLTREAMGRDNNNARKRQASKKRSRKSKDPLKTFSAEGKKKGQGDQTKGDKGSNEAGHKQKKRKAT